MKQGRTLLACLLTAAAVVGGFFLPELVAAVQERTAQPVQVETGPCSCFPHRRSACAKSSCS
ncbi:MAG: hypothetical protein MR778_08690 [Clostridiales bacterium]|nr:hypothetical protein [Clostridiales bacterium]MDD6936120.1 hypothetical protein [Clostridiales bacterium]MDY2962341.1 hypothetical protein [Oscillospiraceae bacterium]